MFEPNRGGNLRCGVQSQGQKDGYDKSYKDTRFFFVCFFASCAFTDLFISETMDMVSCLQMKLWH